MKKVFKTGVVRSLVFIIVLVLGSFGIIAFTENLNGSISDKVDDLTEKEYVVRIENAYETMNASGAYNYAGTESGMFVLEQLEINDIGCRLNTGDILGGSLYSLFTVDGFTTNGYIQKTYSGSSCIEDILESSETEYNIAVSFKRELGYTDSNPGSGHAIFIYAVDNGTVYFTDNNALNSTAPGKPMTLTLEEFYTVYNGKYGAILGAVQFSKSVFTDYCTIKNVGSGRLLNVYNDMDVDNTKVTIQSARYTTGNYFSIAFDGEGFGFYSVCAPTRVMGLSSDNKALVAVNAQNSSWIIEKISSGYLIRLRTNPKMVLTCSGQYSNSRIIVEEFSEGDKYQIWSINRSNIGEFLKQYKVTFDMNGTYEEVLCAYGEVPTPPVAKDFVSRRGIKYFVGYDRELTAVKSHELYTAVYEEKLVDYTVEFYGQDGTRIYKGYYNYEDTIVYPNDPTYKSTDGKNYVFIGWYDSEGNLFNSDKVYNDGVYTAKFVEESTTYTVSFNDWDGSVYYSGQYTVGSEITLPAPPSRPSNTVSFYTFVGWFDENGNEFNLNKVTFDATYTAKYEERELLVQDVENNRGFMGASVVMKSSLTVNFRVLTSDFEEYEKVFAVFEIDHKDYREKRCVIVEDYNILGEYMVFPLKGIAAKEMNDSIKAVLYAVKDGVKYQYNAVNYSITTYVLNRLNASNVTDKERTMLVDLLNYGSKAQIYFEYRLDALANSVLSEEQKAYGSQNVDEIELESIYDYNHTESDPIGFAGVSVLFGDSVKLKFLLDFKNFNGDTDKISIIVTYQDINGNTHKKEIRFSDLSPNGDYFTFTFDGVAIKDMGMPLQVQIFENYDSEEEIQHSGTFNYSIETYAARSVENSDKEEFIDLVKYMMAFSRSAGRYFEK